MPKALDISGQRYGSLTAIRRLGPINRDSLWEFRCDCGQMMQTALGKVRTGHTKSCGCLQREVTRARSLKHGKSNNGGRKPMDRLYNIWGRMKDRCYNPNSNRFSRYGAAGVTVCEEWRASFASFQAWALANGYADALSIDRIDNSRGYEPANCRWANPKEQAANRGGRFAP